MQHRDSLLTLIKKQKPPTKTFSEQYAGRVHLPVVLVAIVEVVVA